MVCYYAVYHKPKSNLNIVLISANVNYLVMLSI